MKGRPSDEISQRKLRKMASWLEDAYVFRRLNVGATGSFIFLVYVLLAMKIYPLVFGIFPDSFSPRLLWTLALGVPLAILCGLLVHLRGKRKPLRVANTLLAAGYPVTPAVLDWLGL